MGGCPGKDNPDPETVARYQQSKAVESFLRAEAKKTRKERKILLLGAGDSGKSTFFRQIKMLHRQPFSTEERLFFRSVIYENIHSSATRLILAMKKIGATVDAHVLQIADRLAGRSASGALELTAEVVADLREIWSHSTTQMIIDRISDFQIQQTIIYFMNELDRIAALDYLPTDLDIFHSRSRTTGILEMTFTYKGTDLVLTDVGGQRSERKKWIHCFQDVTCVLFFASLCEFEQKLFEDESVNRFQESLELFEEIANSHWFRNTPIVLLLNKKDLLKSRLPRIDFSKWFPDDPSLGPSPSFTTAARFIQSKYVSLNHNPLRQITVHFTCALSTANTAKVFAAIHDSVLMSSLSQAVL